MPRFTNTAVCCVLSGLMLAAGLHAAERTVPTTSKEAIQCLQIIWKDSLATKLASTPGFAQLQRQMFEPGRVGARSTQSRVAWDRVSNSLTAAEKKEFIIFGQLDDLKQDRPIWAVTNPGDFHNGFEAYLDAATGELLFIWITPEG